MDYTDYVREVSQLYKKYVFDTQKAKKIRVSVRPYWCTVTIYKGFNSQQFDFTDDKHLDNGYTNEVEWEAMIKYLEE